MFDRRIESGLLDVIGARRLGCIAFSPLEQGLLTDRYLNGVPADSRMAQGQSLTVAAVNQTVLTQIRALHSLAVERGQTLAQMALAWALRDRRVTSVVIGASTVGQLDSNLMALQQPGFSPDELNAIERVLSNAPIS